MKQLILDYDYLLFFVGALVLTFIVAKLVKFYITRLINRSVTHAHVTDKTKLLFFRQLIVAAVYIAGIALAISFVPSLRAVAASILAGAGVLAVAIGFASQAALSNLISGAFIVLFQPFKVGQRITVRDTKTGIVEDITLRHTVIRDFENRRIVIPNSVISNEIIVNADMTEERVARFVDVGISYGSDVELAKTIMAECVAAHPLLVDTRTPEDLEKGTPLVLPRVILLADSSVNLRAVAWTKNAADAHVLGCDLNETLKARFEAAGIEIPFPHRTVYTHRVEAPGGAA